MCMSCGCGDYPNCHNDIRNITSLNFSGACDAMGLDPDTVTQNLMTACADVGPTVGQDPTGVKGVSGLIVKSEEEQRYTLTVAYPANKPDVAVAQDGHRDFASLAAVEKAAWDYLRKSPKVGLWHRDGTDGSGQVVESYIYRGPDWTINAPDESQQIIKSGDWLMGIVWDEPTWALVKSGMIRGVSPQGRARRRIPHPNVVANLRG